MIAQNLSVEHPVPDRARTRTAAVWRNALLLAALWAIYSLVRAATGSTQLEAVDNAARLLAFEESLGIDIERTVQTVVAWPQAFVAANAYYLVHFPMTLIVLAVAFWRGRHLVFPVVRNALIGCTTAALAIHLVVPMAPPRMLPGFVDAGRDFGPDPYSVAGSDSANQFAAMPSMHVAWAIIAGYVIWNLSHHRLARAAAVAHPAITTFVVILTGHHFIADVVVGGALATTALVVAGRPQTSMARAGSRTITRASAEPRHPCTLRHSDAQRRDREPSARFLRAPRRDRHSSVRSSRRLTRTECPSGDRPAGADADADADADAAQPVSVTIGQTVSPDV